MREPAWHALTADHEAWEALGRTAMEWYGWRWLPGMLVLGYGVEPGSRVIEVRGGRINLAGHRSGPFSSFSALPDFNDPATQGCALELLREAYRHGPERDVSIERVGRWNFSLAVRNWDSERKSWVYDGEVHGGRLAGKMYRDPDLGSGIDRPTYHEGLVAALECAPVMAHEGGRS